MEIDWLSVFFSGLPAVIVGASLTYWFHKKLAKQKGSFDKEILTLQSKIDKKSYVHRIQFEKEFNIYTEIWEKLFDLNQKTLSLRPIFDYVDPSKTREETIRQRLEEFGECYNTFVKTYGTNKPFYHEEVFNCLKAILRVSRIEAIDYEQLQVSDRGYWDKQKQNTEDLEKLIEECCVLIRKRIGNIQVSD
ncbi:MAG: hypothetical protein AAF549_06935 [Pseudomonadota bacterium]